MSPSERVRQFCAFLVAPFICTVTARVCSAHSASAQTTALPYPGAGMCSCIYFLPLKSSRKLQLVWFLDLLYCRPNRNDASRAVVSDRWVDQLWPHAGDCVSNSFEFLCCTWRATVLSSDFNISSCLGPVYILKFVTKNSFSIKYYFFILCYVDSLLPDVFVFLLFYLSKKAG